MLQILVCTNLSSYHKLYSAYSNKIYVLCVCSRTTFARCLRRRKIILMLITQHIKCAFRLSSLIMRAYLYSFVMLNSALKPSKRCWRAVSFSSSLHIDKQNNEPTTGRNIHVISTTHKQNKKMQKQTIKLKRNTKSKTKCSKHFLHLIQY